MPRPSKSNPNHAAELDAALARWRETRSAEDADLIDVLSGSSGGRANWPDVRGPVAASEVGPLLRELPTTDVREMTRRIKVLQTWPADPRVSRALAELIRNVTLPWHAHRVAIMEDIRENNRLTEPFFTELLVWEPVSELLLQLADVRVLPILREALERPRGKTLMHRQALGRVLRQLIPELEERTQEVTAPAAPMKPSPPRRKQSEVQELLGDAALAVVPKYCRVEDGAAVRITLAGVEMAEWTFEASGC